MTGSEGWTEVGGISDIPLRGARRVKLAGLTVAVFRTADNEIYALEDRCPHKAGPLSQGIVHDCAVTCPLHNLVIDLASGRPRDEDGPGAATFPVRLQDGRILLDLRPAGQRAA